MGPKKKTVASLSKELQELQSWVKDQLSHREQPVDEEHPSTSSSGSLAAVIDDTDPLLPPPAKKGRKTKNPPAATISSPQVDPSLADSITTRTTRSSKSSTQTLTSQHQSTMTKDNAASSSSTSPHVGVLPPDEVNGQSDDSPDHQRDAMIELLQREVLDLKAALQNQHSSLQSSLVSPATITSSLHKSIAGQDVLEEESSSSQQSDLAVLTPFLVAGATVSDKTKDKIWEFQYIDLTTLLPKQDRPFTTSTATSQQPSQTTTRPFSSWTEWYKAFTIYAAVYISKYKDEGPNILTYMWLLQDLAYERPQTYAWRYYDELFRQVRSRAHTLSWQVIHQPLLARAKIAVEESARLAFRRSTKTQQITQQPSQTPAPSKPMVCFEYNSRYNICKRTNCKYPHKCSRCSGSHPFHMCRANNNNPTSTGNNTSSKSAQKK